MSSPYATGGTVIQGIYGVDAGYLHVFDTPGGGNFVPLYILNCTVVVIAGGGAGGLSSTTAGSETSGGGGGAGGYALENFPNINPQTVANYAITVGDGATTSVSSGDSSFTAQPLSPPSVPLIVAGGGGDGGNGVGGNNGIVPITGTNNYSGCGGGGGSTENAGTATNVGGSGYFKGGDSQNNPSVVPFTAGGGGGYASAGSDRNVFGVGGGGIVNPFASFTGQSAKVCAGGGGGEDLASAGNGGDGGGGNGANSSGTATSGFTYGSGGGGGYSLNNLPGFGFKGAVMIFYPTPAPANPVVGLGIIATSFEEQTISWIAPAGVVDEYWVYVTANPSNYGSPITVSGLATTFTANTASVGFTYLPSTTYYFRVVVRVTGKPNSNPVDTSGQTSAPPAPTGFSVTVNNPTSQTVVWTEPTPAPTSYNFYATTNPSNYGLPTVLSPPDVSRTVTGLTPGTTYYYRINADHTIGGNNYPSANVDTSAVTPVPPPTGFTVSVNNQTSQTLVWVAPSPAPTTYNFYSTTNPSNYGSPTSIAGGLTSRVQSGLTAGTTYYYRIVAVSNSVSSTNVDTSATTPSPAPAGLYYKPLQIRSPVGRGANDYPGRHPGRGLPATQTLWMSSL